MRSATSTKQVFPTGERRARATVVGRALAPRAFTLVELLVVMGVIAILVGLTLPAIGKARRAAEAARDLSAAQQIVTAYIAYADDHRGNLLPGYPTAAMVNPAANPNAIVVTDDQGAPVTGVSARRYPWRLAPYLGSNAAALFKDPRFLETTRSRIDYQYQFSLSPSFGLNSTFLGGDSERFAFNPAAAARWGSFFLTRLDQAHRPAQLLAFVSSRGVNPNAAGDAPGFFRVDSPYLLNRVWAPAYDADAAPDSFGFVHARYDGKAITALLDGHAQTNDPDELTDMRRWADRADRPDWVLGP